MAALTSHAQGRATPRTDVRPTDGLGRAAFVHGFLGSPRSWDGVRSHLATHDHLALTLLGHGARRDDDELAVASFEDEVTRLLARLAREHIDTLVGYSLGARVALGLAARSPRPFSRLVLVSGRDGLDDQDEARSRCVLDDALASSLLAEGLPRFVDRWEALPLFESQQALDASLRASHRARRLEHAPEGVASALRILSLGRMPRFASAALARTPRVELVVGERDAKFRALAERLVAEHGPHVCLRVVARAGHDVVLERPDALADLLQDRP